MRLSKKLVASVSIVAAGTLVAGIAFAAWTANGSGSGSAAAGHAELLVASTATTAGLTLLYPGGNGDANVTINNPNPYAVTVALSQNGAVTSSNTLCDAGTGVSLATTTGLIVAPGSAVYLLAGKASMSNASVNACQDAVFTIPVSLVGASS